MVYNYFLKLIFLYLVADKPMDLEIYFEYYLYYYL